MKHLLNIIFFISIIYIIYWAYSNVDYVSVFKDSKSLVKYEFEKENLKTSIESFAEVIKKRMQ